jgi:RHS repeat-associated protein
VTLYEQSRHAGYQGPEGGKFLGQPGQRIDLDRDGREDLLMEEDYSIARITAAEVSSDPFDGRPVWPTPVDLNGDGCTDLVYHHYTGYWRARFSGCAGPYWAAPEVQGPPGPASARPVVLDWNGDGKQDLLLRDTASWQLMMSGGDRLLPLADTGLAHGGATSQAMADVDGDGLDDLLARASGQLRLRLHRGARPDLLAGVSDGFEVAASFAYAPITRPEAYTPLTGAVYPQREWRDARAVVVAMSATDGSGTGTRSTQTFAYEGLREDAQGRGSLGFARRIVSAPVGGETLRTDEAWRQDFPFTGLPRARVIRRASGRVVADSAWEYAQLTLGSGAAARRYPYVRTSTANHFEAGGAYDGALHTTLSYSVAQLDSTSGAVLDASWTTTEQGTGLNTGASRTQRLWLPQVLNDVTNWCLGRPTSAQLTQSHTLPGGEPLTRTASASWDGLRCRLTQHQAEPGNAQWQLTTALGYDAFGNVASVAITGAGMATRTTRIDWGTRGAAPASITDPLSQVARLAWEPGRGLLLSFTDANALATSWTYDAFGRLASEQRPDGTRRVLGLYACTPAADCGQASARYRLRASEQSPAGATEWYEEWALDRFDRWIVHRGQQANGALSARTRSFDARGRLQRENLPHWSGGTPPGYLQVVWDVLDRPVSAGLYSAAGAAQRLATFERRGLAVTQRDAAGRASTTVSTAWGDAASVTDAAGGSTRYRHDAAGRLLQVADAYGGVLTSLSWNPRGMKLAQTDVDLGATSFTPNALGELVSVRNARGQVTRFTYDALSRLLSRTEPEGTASWTWGRPAENTAGARVAGRLLRVAAPGYAEQFAYDALARPVKRSIVADATYEYDLGYDALGRPDWLRYPASAGGYRFRLGYEYANGHLRRIRDYDSPATTFWRLEAVDAAGQLLDETRGGGLRVITGVSPVTGEIEYRQSGAGSGAAVQNLAWRWETQGNLIERSDLNAAVTERFTYDALDRLDDVRRNGVLTLDVAYDLAGNITSRSDVGGYAYHATRKHAVTAAGSHRYGYDANGNMSSRDGRPVNWSSYDLPITVDGADGSSSTFWYGPDRQRWRQVASSAGGFETTVYAGGLLEKSTRGSVTTWKHYVATPGGVAALHVRSNDGQAPRTWLLTQDALGSTDRVVDAAGKVVLATSFDAFGSRRGLAWSGAPTAAELDAAARTTRDGFTGHEQLDHLGLVHMGGRLYDPVIGRFLSADPVVQAPFWSQDLNRYSYAWNNPLSIVDPSGYAEEIPCLMDQGRCAQVTVYGLRDDRGLGGLQGGVFGAWMRAGYNGQAASAWQRDPCGQDGSADACRPRAAAMDAPVQSMPVASVSGPAAGVERPALGADYYLGRTIEFVGLSLIAFDVANTVSGVLAGPDTAILGAPLIAAGVELRQGKSVATTALRTYWPPNRGFADSATRSVLRPGTRIDRYGSELGTFASPAGTPFPLRALPPQALKSTLRSYEVLKPLPARNGATAPWFGQPGGGTQYEFAQSIETLVQQGYLKRIP